MGVALEMAAKNTVIQKVIQKASRDRRIIPAIAIFNPGFPLFETLSIAIRGKDGRLVGPPLPYCII